MRVKKVTLLALALLLLGACRDEQNQSAMHTNALINEKSPYLLQHAHNPVNWLPWGDEAFAKAEAENKLVIVSIGYSACHWCHVMEHETFEDSAAAALMNEHFICIKVDREEHPDVDQVYMTAVQLMTGQGGWPLNTVTLPDGKPIWGGTYFPRQQWMNTLQNIVDLRRNEPQKILDYAAQLTEGVQQAELVEAKETTPFSVLQADELFENWQTRFDREEGGGQRAPKFPMPNNYAYLLHYGHLRENKKALKHVALTLNKMAEGGIYDQVGGGFARYSTDAIWKAPHFEKMLYDNAQLITLYADAWRVFKAPLYAKTVQETVHWAMRELSGSEGQFYTALDADSEGEEGKFYVWTEAELKGVIPTQEWEAFRRYYDLTKGQWENHIILMRNGEEALNPDKEAEWQQLLRTARSKRTRPGLDDKALCSWNALMITALAKANPLSAQKDTYLKRAEACADWLLHYQLDKTGHLKHAYKNKEAYLDGLLEDYAFSIEAFLQLYSSTGKESYLQQAQDWLKLVELEFSDPQTGLFFSRNKTAKALIAKSMETADNVMPASNSVMAKNLFQLGHLLGEQAYTQRAEKMLGQLSLDRFLSYGESYSNWAQLHLWLTLPYYEIAAVGASADVESARLQQHYLPNCIVVFSTSKSESVLMRNRLVAEETRIYVCQNQTCKLPVNTTKEALALLKP